MIRSFSFTSTAQNLSLSASKPETLLSPAASLNAMLEKKLSLGDAIYERKLWVYGNVLKGPAMAWFSQLLRLNA